MGSVYEEITRLETAKADIETAIEGCGVNVPDTDLISTYALYIRQIPSAVFSELNVDPVGGDDKYIKSIKQVNGLIEATTGGLVSSTSSGIVPKVINTNTATVGSAYYVLASSNGSSIPSWYKLPANVFKNDNTTYTFANGATGNFTVTPSGGTKQTVSIGKPSTAGTADIAVKLQTKRKLWGLDFDGSADVNGNLTSVGNITINATGNKDYFINFLYNSTPAYSWRLGYLGSGSENANYFVIDSSKSSGGTWHRALQIGNETLDATFAGTVTAPTFIGNLDGTHVNALTDYTKSTTASNIADTDTLNTALGKLEYKAHHAYNWVTTVTATDTDAYINKWGEIVGFLDSVKEGTDILDEFVTKETDLTITGSKTFTASTNTFSGTGASILTVDRNSTNPAWIRFCKNGTLQGYIGITNDFQPVFLSGEAGSSNKTLLHAGNYTAYVNTTNFPGLNSVGDITGVTAGAGLSGGGTSGSVTLTNAGVRSTTINGNYLRVNTNGTNADLTIPFATKSTNANYFVGCTNSITVDGDANTYYPVVVSTTYNKKFQNIITVWKDLGSTTASYTGNHSNGTASMLYRYDIRNNMWDGNGGYCTTLDARYMYAPLVAETTMLGSGVGNFCIWLRGGGTLYNISTSWSVTANDIKIYYSSINVGSTEHPVNINSRTTIGNAGIYNSIVIPCLVRLASKLGSSTFGGTYQPIYLNSGTATTGTSYAKAIKSITRSGTTFTYTCIDGTTGTFTQQDNNSTYAVYGNTINASYKTAYRTLTKGNTTNGYYISAIRCNTASVSGAPLYGSGIAFGMEDTHGYLYTDYNSSNAYIGGGNADKLNWTATLLHSGNSSVSKSGETLTVKINGVEQSLTNTKYSSLKNPNAIKFKKTDGTTVTYDGSSAADLTAGVNYATSAGNADTVDNLHLYTRTLGVNGTDWTFASTANSNATTHIYAATSAGTSGLILKSTGGTPTWMNASDLTAGKVTCTEATSNTDRPIVLTNKSNGLYYSTKATINYSTGNITAPTFTGNLNGGATLVYVNNSSSNGVYPVLFTNTGSCGTPRNDSLYVDSASGSGYNPNTNAFVSSIMTAGTHNSTSTLYLSSANGCSIIFKIGNVEKARFALPNGYLGINTTTITYPLTVNGTALVNLLRVSTANLYRDAGGIILNNSDIWGVNAIYTVDLADNAGEGYQFKRSNSNYDSIWCQDGTFYFSPDGNPTDSYDTNYTVYHSGNLTKSTIGLGNVQNTAFYQRTTTVNGTNWNMAGTNNYAAFTIYAPTTAGTAGLVLISNGSGAPVWGSLPSHSHAYLPLAGGTMNNTAIISRKGYSVSWYLGRDGAMIRTTEYNGYNPILSMKTTNGSWDLGVYSSDTAYLTYITDTDYNTPKNTCTYQLTFPKKTGTLAVTTDIPTSLPANGGNADTVDTYHIVVCDSSTYEDSSKDSKTIYFVY